MKVMIICGGRDYRPSQQEYNMVRVLIREMEITHVIHGGAKGVDTMLGNAIGHSKLVPVTMVVVPALWDKHGKSAGPKRNRAMAAIAERLDEEGCPIVVCFTGGRGTADMRAVATEKDFHIADISVGEDDDE
jgi:predicted Rossmann-fold nucleotide-binding protein